MKKLCIVVLIAILSNCKPKPHDRDKGSVLNKTDINSRNLDLRSILNEWSGSFVKKVDSNYRATVNFRLSDSTKHYSVNIKDKRFEISSGTSDEANFTFESSSDHYNRIYKGDMTALTSMGQATSGDPIPLKPDLHKPVTDNLVNDFLFFSQRFFNSYPYDLVKLGIEHSRIVHGGHAIPLFYQKSDGIGVRSAWYQINKGERVNEPGDTNPFPQYFIVIKGSGYAKIGSDTIQLQANHAYYIPPDNDHVFWNDNKDPVELIFLAWGKGA